MFCPKRTIKSWFRVIRIWSLNAKVMYEKIAPKEVFTNNNKIQIEDEEA
jgi:hypothetical protein